MQTDFCGVGGYVDSMGYDLSLTRAPIAPISRRARGRCGRGIHHHPHARGASARPLRPARQQALALAAHRRGHRRCRPLRQDPRARRARLGDHPRAGAAAGRDVIDKPGKGSFCATDLELILRTARHRQHRADGHHHRRLRPHDDARGQRPRLRMPAAGGLLRRDRPRQPSRRDQDGDDAGRRLRRRRSVGRAPRRAARRRTCEAARDGCPSPRGPSCIGCRRPPPDDVSGLARRRGEWPRSIPPASSPSSARPRAMAASTTSTRGYRHHGALPPSSHGMPRAGAAAALCLVMSGGTEGGLSPHVSIFEVRDAGPDAVADPGSRALAVGQGPHAGAAARAPRARSPRSASSPRACAAAMADAGITDRRPTSISSRSSARC